MQTNKMRAILATLTPLTGIDAEQVRIRAVEALTQRDADFGDRYVACHADGEEILAGMIMLAIWKVLVFLYKAENSTAHENVGMGAMVRFDLFEAFIHPIDAILAVNHTLGGILTVWVRQESSLSLPVPRIPFAFAGQRNRSRF